MRSAPLILALLTLTATLPLAAASAAQPVSSWGPDDEGAWWLAFDVSRDAPGPARLALSIVHADGGPSSQAARDLGVRDLPAGTTRLNLSFLPAEGPGDYAVALVVDGAASAPLSFHVEGVAGASATLAFEVPDHPTWLNLTPDAVNADGKTKSPGEDLITRATIRDENGLAGLSVRWVVTAPGFADAGWVAVPSGGVNASLEHRYARTPLPNATYRLALEAVREGAVVVSAARTFVIRDAPTTLLPFSVPSVAPDVDVEIPVDLVLADRNGAPGGSTLEARVYRGTTRAEASGLAAAFAHGGNATDPASGVPAGEADGAALTRHALTLRVPAGLAPSSYRLSIVLDGVTLGSAAFHVTALPALGNVTAVPDGDVLVVTADGSGEGLLVVSLRDGAQETRVEAPFRGNATVRVPAPGPGRDLAWNATLLARPGGAVLAAREGAWSRAAPDVVLRLERGLPRLPAAWSADAPGWDLAGAQATVEVTRWDGAPEPAIRASFDGARLLVDGPAGLAPGRYAATIHLRFANGTEGVARVEFEAGPWVRLHLGAPAVAGRNATLAVANEGGLAVRRVVAEVDGNATLSLVAGGQVHAPRVTPAGRLVFEGFTLAPGEEAVLVARLAEGPLPAGAHAVQVRLVATAGGA